jgi:hypothetical protein
MQHFVLDENPSGGWGSGWTTDPVSGGYLFYSWGLPFYLRVQLAYGTAGNTVSQITWYQVLPSGTSPANISPGGNFGMTSGSVTIAPGYTGYDVSQAT